MSNKTKSLSRRNFIKTSGALGGGAMMAPNLLVADHHGQKLRIAHVGTGGRAGAHVNMAAGEGCICNTYCDVDESKWGSAKSKWPKAKGYRDYREMLEKEKDNYDAVSIATPDHHHYSAAIMAMKLGKHVYCEKPLTHTVWEARQLGIARDKYKLATQMGNQGHSNEGNRLMVEWIQQGALGNISEVHCWTNRPVWPQPVANPKKADEIPANIDWDVYLGPAPKTQLYKNGIYPFKWRGFWHFGAGALGDMGCHTMDAFYWAMDPGAPTSVECLKKSEMIDGNFPKSSVVKMKFPAKKGQKAFDFYWYDGGEKPDPALGLGRKLPGTGCIFVGDKASIMSAGDYGDSPRIIPEAKMREIGKPKRTLERSVGHYKEFVLAATGKKPIDYPGSNFGYASPFSETVLLGNVALRCEGELKWDSKNLKITNNADANKIVNKEYHNDWPAPAA